MIRTWWERPSMMDDRDKRLAVLSAAERARMQRYLRVEDQDRSLAAWSTARLVLGELLGSDPAQLAFDRSCLHCGHPEHGRPRLTGDPVHFSLSHSGDRVLLAVSAEGPVGADVELLTTRHDDLARMVLHTSEEVVSGEALMRIWVRKEAVLKASGHGLGRAMTSFAVATGEVTHWPDDTRITLTDLPADDGYLASVALFHR